MFNKTTYPNRGFEEVVVVLGGKGRRRSGATTIIVKIVYTIRKREKKYGERRRYREFYDENEASYLASDFTKFYSKTGKNTEPLRTFPNRLENKKNIRTVHDSTDKLTDELSLFLLYPRAYSQM